MAFIGSLITTVKANVDPFKKKIFSAAKTVRKFGKDIVGISAKIGKFGLGLAAVAAGGLLLYTLRAFKAIDATAKLAAELDISTSSLTSFQLAAGLTGTDTETLNKALRRMARTVGEARAGITTGTKALEDFNIGISELEGLSTEQIFERFSEEISGMEDPLERAAKASLIFGKAGQKLLNFLALGKDGLAAVKAEIDEMGLAFDEVDAAKVEAANDAILRMTTIADGLGNTIAIAVAPFVEELANNMTDFIKSSGGIDDIVKNNLGPMADKLAFIADLIQIGKIAFNTFTLAVKLGVGGIVGALTVLDQGIRGILRAFGADIPQESFLKNFVDETADQVIEDFNDITQAAKDFNKAASSNKVRETFSKIAEESNNVAEAIRKSADEQKKLNEETRKQALELAMVRKEQQQLEADRKKIVSEAMKIFEATRTPLENVESEIIRINELLTKGLDKGLQEGLQRKLAELKKERENLERGLDDTISISTGEGLGEIGEEISNVIDGIKSPLEEILARSDALIADFKQIPGETRAGGFKQLDLKNIDIAGLERSGDFQKQTLKETEKTNQLLGTLIDVTGTAQSGGIVAL